MGWEAGGQWEPGVPSVRWGPPTAGRSAHHRNALPDSSWTIAISPASVRNAFLLWSALPQGRIIPPVQRDADSQLSFISLRCRFPDPGTPPC